MTYHIGPGPESTLEAEIRLSGLHTIYDVIGKFPAPATLTSGLSAAITTMPGSTARKIPFPA
jgi:hypothetical protein